MISGKRKENGFILRFTALVLSLLIAFSAFCGGAYAAEEERVFCDADCDGELSAADARQVLRFAVDLDYYTEGHLKVCGMVADERFTASEARYILRLCVGLEESDITSVKVDSDSFTRYINKEPVKDIFDVPVPSEPAVNAPSDTFTFTVYGWGHGVGLSQYGAISFEKHGYKYNEILSHYYTGTEVKFIEEFPTEVIYPTLCVSEETGEEEWQFIPRPIEEIMVRMVYQEIYGVTESGKYKEALKAMTVCIFTNLVRFDFDVKSRWDVGIAFEGDYEKIPEELKSLVREVLGQYITQKGDTEPINAVYSALSAGTTASSQSVWGFSSPYLTAVPSPFDMLEKSFISQFTYTSAEMKELITAFDEAIVLSEDPAQWLEILEHTASMDKTRGYVTKIRVGDKVLSGYSEFQYKLMNNKFVSSCFTVTYTP